MAEESKKNVKGVLAIAYNLDDRRFPYSVLAANLSAELFDSAF